MSPVKLICITDDAEATMAYVARVSSPHQENPEYARLLKYCLDHQHWSVFEHASATVEITTSRMISAQILRHRSFTFSEFSQRYSEAQAFVPYQARRQDEKNRQNSIDDLDDDVLRAWEHRQRKNWDRALSDYRWAIDHGIAKECARAVLPMQTATRIYMTGSIRSWITYLALRTSPDTQLEHREIALAIREILSQHLPTIAEAAGWIQFKQPEGSTNA